MPVTNTLLLKITYVQGIITFFNSLFTRKRDVCGRRKPCPHEAVPIPYHHFTEFQTEISHWSKGHHYNPNIFCIFYSSSQLPYVLHPCLTRTRKQKWRWGKLWQCCFLQSTTEAFIFHAPEMLLHTSFFLELLFSNWPRIIHSSL